MRRIANLLLLVIAIVCISGTAPAQENQDKPDKNKRGGKVVRLFNGESLAGWQCFADAEDVKMEDIWSVKDGILICKGEPLGYLYTKEEYTNFKLLVVWRWAPDAEPGNSGILLRITGDAVSFLPKCAECQLKSGSAGDVYGFYGFNVKGPEDRFKIIESQKLGKISAVGKIEAAEKKAGRWNKAEITVDGGTITVVINGKEVNKVTDCDVVAGRIGLQSEGGEVHFRRVQLVPIAK